MAHVFSLTDGSTTVTLTQANGFVVTAFDQATVEDSKDKLDDEPEITETIDMLVISSTTAGIQTLVHSVEAMIVAAQRRRQQQIGPRIYMQLQIDAEASTWRAEIKDGRFKPDKDTLETWYSKKVPYHLMVTHCVWEGPETEIQLSTSNAAAATGGRTIYNHDDAGTGHDNWVQIASTQVGGVLPTPVKLVLTNSTGSGFNTRNFFLATNAFSDPANFVHMIEGEARTTIAGTTTADAGDSSGNYYNFTFTNAGNIHWDLSAAQMQRTQGRKFKLLMRMHGWSGTNFYVKAILRDVTGTIAFRSSKEILLGTSGSYIIDLGALPLPTGGYQAAWGAMVLELSLRCTGAGVFNIDYIQLTPLDAYQEFAQQDFTIANASGITFDNIEGVYYHSVGGPLFTPLSGPLKVFPGVTQRIIILQDEGNVGGSNISRTFSVRAYIRERRLTV